MELPSGMQRIRTLSGEIAGGRTRNSPNARAKMNQRGKGDPRMHHAVAARKQNPHITLLDALLVGGFEFPAIGVPGITDKTCFDPEHVSLYQRKNQLNRRLRFEKRKDNTPSSHAQSKSSKAIVPNRCLADCIPSHIDTVTAPLNEESKQGSGEADSFPTIVDDLLQEAFDDDSFVTVDRRVEEKSEEGGRDAAQVSTEELLLFYQDKEEVISWNALLSPISDFQF